jgi:molybdopterin-containing oxidoreductase family iron-sulfur binding subunit
MIYNRCVGTKYCSNNCPYKVRRFNWYNNNGDMNSLMEHPLALSKNPEVTLRSRGVMEKCTFCVQRIEYGKSEAKTAGRRAGDDDIKTACQEACAADAIVFGDVNNPDSKVAKLKKSQRGFASLNELNARPAITYLSKVRNRAPEKTEKA